MSETQSNGGAELPKVISSAEVFGTQPAQAAPEPPQVEDAPEEQHGVEESSEAPAEHGEEDAESPAKRAKEKTPKGVQRRFDELTKQNAELKREREQLLALMQEISGKSQKEPEAPAAKPQPREFTSDVEYVDALMEWRLEQMRSTIRQEIAEEAKASQFAIREEASKKAHDDYDIAISNFIDNGLAMMPLVAQAIDGSPIGPEIAYYLGANPDVMDELIGKPAYRQAAMLAKIEDELLGGEKPKEDKPPKVSKAPPPPGQIGQGATVQKATHVDTAYAGPDTMAKVVAEMNREREKRGLRPLR